MAAFMRDMEAERPTCFSTFTGCGGMDLGLHKYLRPVAYCEKEPACIEVLRARMAEGSLDEAKILTDICSVTADDFVDTPDAVTGGFPCIDVCVAGRKKGMIGSQTVLFKHIIRLLHGLSRKFGRPPTKAFL